MIYKTLAMSDDYDLIIDDNGYIKIDEDSPAVADRLKIELASNNSWYLDLTLGINWVDANGTGLLQYKNSEVSIVNAIEKKLSSINGVKEIKEMTLNPKGERGLQIYITVVTTLNEEINIYSEV